MSPHQVEVLVHVGPADNRKRKHFELLTCPTETSIKDLKRQVEERGATGGEYSLSAVQQEIYFLNQLCKDDMTLADCGINEEFIKQVTGFVVLKKVS